MRIGAIQKTTLIDYPGKISAVIFVQGCNFRCGYCHNPELVNQKLWGEPLSEKEVFTFLRGKIGKLQGVCITGGEPALQSDLLDFVKKIKEMGYLVKLDTNGSKPKALQNLLIKDLVNYVAMDIKGPLGKYKKITHSKIDPERILESINLLQSSKINFEFRTTVVKKQLEAKDILEIGTLVKGAPLYVLQRFVPTKVLDPNFMDEESYSREEFERLRKSLEKYVKKCVVRF